MQYMTSLAPPALTATAISIMATIIWVLGKGVGTTITHVCHHFISEKQDEGRECHIPVQAGSMLSGVLYNQFGMRGMFLVVGAGLIAIALAYLLLYHLALKRSLA